MVDKLEDQVDYAEAARVLFEASRDRFMRVEQCYEAIDALAQAGFITDPTPTEDARERVKALEGAEDVEEALQYLEGFPSDPREVEGRITALGGSRLDAAIRALRTALGNKETDRHG